MKGSSSDPAANAPAARRSRASWFTPRVVTYACALLGAAIFASVILPTGGDLLSNPIAIVAFFVAFYLAEIHVLDIWVGKERQSVSVSDVATVTAIFYIHPTTFVVAGTLAMATSVFIHRRQRGVKLAFNTSMKLLDLSLMAWLFRLMADNQSTLDPTAWFAAILAAAVSGAVSFIAIHLAIEASRGNTPSFSARTVRMLGFDLAVIVTNASLALLAVSAIHRNLAALWLVLIPTVTLYVAYRDMVALREAETKLGEIKRMYELILGTVQGAIYVKDLDGRYTYANRAFLDLTRLEREEVIGQRARDLFPHSAEEWEKNDAQVIESGEIMTSEEHLHLYGRDSVFLSIKAPLLDESGSINGLCGFSTDITEKKMVEERLNQSQKLEAVGQLAGGIAHDFNNLLAVISNYASFLLDDMKTGEVKPEDAEQILAASRNAAGLTRRLLTFSRRDSGTVYPLDLNDTIDDLYRLLRSMIRADVELATDQKRPLPKVVAEPSQIEQILTNITVNSAEAMPEGGRLSLSTRTVSVGPLGSPALGLGTGEYVALQITDTGHGMSPEVKEHLFEPFFTTKPAGEGTGLGLASVYRIVHSLNGHIHVESSPGAGATFTIFLPAAPEEDALALSLDGPRSLRALVVEDQEAVGDVVERILTRHGHTVLRASSGAEAVLLAETEPIDVLITDIVMPGMTGTTLADRLGIPTLFMSGYSERELEGDRLGPRRVALLHKPFTQAELLSKLDEALAGSGSTPSPS